MSLGVLTSTFIPPTRCIQSFATNYRVPGGWDIIGPISTDGCLPTDYKDGASAFYSPGVCPSGMTSACSSFLPIGPSGTVTVVTCCPTFYTCDPDPPIFYSTSYYACNRQIPTYSGVQVTIDGSGVSSTLTIPSESPIGIYANAFGVQIRFQSTDFPASTTSASVSSTAESLSPSTPSNTRALTSSTPSAGQSTTTNQPESSAGASAGIQSSSPSTSSNTQALTSSTSSGGQSTPANPAQSSGGLSSGAAAGIGVGAGLGALLIAGAIIFAFLRGRRSGQRGRQGDEVADMAPQMSYDPGSNSAALHERAELHETHVERQKPELDAQSRPAYEIYSETR